MTKDLAATTALVLGGYGAVGRHLVSDLRADGFIAYTTGRDSTRADVTVDLSEPDYKSYRTALDGIDVVINTAGVEDPQLAALAAAHGAAFVDITATSDYVHALEALAPAGAVLLSVGIAPGLTNLVAGAAFNAAPGPIDIAVLLGAGEHHGAAATTWTYDLMRKTFRHNDAIIRNYTHPRRFELPGFGRRTLYRADFSDQHTLTRELATPVRTYLGLDSRIATTALTAATRLPFAMPRIGGIPFVGTDKWLVLARNHNGGTLWAQGQSQSRGTATVAALATRIATRLPPGVHHLHQTFTLDDLPPNLGITCGRSD